LGINRFVQCITRRKLLPAELPVTHLLQKLSRNALKTKHNSPYATTDAAGRRYPQLEQESCVAKVDMLAVLQEEKSQLEGVLAEVQGRLDARDVQLQDAVRQLNISKFMLADSDDARSQVDTVVFTPVFCPSSFI